MSVFIIRLFIFTILPLLFAAFLVAMDKSVKDRKRRYEVYLIYLFSLGVSGSGIANFIGHVFIADVVAEYIGWPSGSPFQLEVAFANLALGILGTIAANRRDGFREATVIAVTVFSVGATMVHVGDIIQSGNWAPGNSLQNLSNLLKPSLLIAALAGSRRVETASEPLASQTSFDSWRGPISRVAGITTSIVMTGFGLGFSVGQPLTGTALGVVIGSFLTWKSRKHANSTSA